MQAFRPFLLAVIIPAVLPLPAQAQAAITGTVKDTSGTVLPGPSRWRGSTPSNAMASS